MHTTREEDRETISNIQTANALKIWMPMICKMSCETNKIPAKWDKNEIIKKQETQRIIEQYAFAYFRYLILNTLEFQEAN